VRFGGARGGAGAAGAFYGTHTQSAGLGAQGPVDVGAPDAGGGHDVAEPIIEQRYQMGMSYLKAKVLDFSDATLIDVSTHEPRRMAQLLNGRIVFKDPNCPLWVHDSLELAEKIELRRRSVQ